MEPLRHRTSLIGIPLQPHARHHVRRASDLRGIFIDEQALQRLIDDGDPIIYETYEPAVPELEGHLMYGITTLYPGRVGDEYFMTRGHYHIRRHTAEVYYGLRGQGYLLMQSANEPTVVAPVEAGTVVYVPPGLAHRSVNAEEGGPLVLLYTFPANAGHDYEAIRKQRFTHLIVHAEGGPRIVERMHWLATRAPGGTDHGVGGG